MSANDAERFIVRIEAYAGAGPVELADEDLERDASDQIRRIIDDLNHADPDRIEDQTYRSLRFDLCAACHRSYLANPLG